MFVVVLFLSIDLWSGYTVTYNGYSEYGCSGTVTASYSNDLSSCSSSGGSYAEYCAAMPTTVSPTHQPSVPTRSPAKSPTAVPTYTRGSPTSVPTLIPTYASSYSSFHDISYTSYAPHASSFRTKSPTAVSTYSVGNPTPVSALLPTYTLSHASYIATASHYYTTVTSYYYTSYASYTAHVNRPSPTPSEQPSAVVSGRPTAQPTSLIPSPVPSPISEVAPSLYPSSASTGRLFLLVRSSSVLQFVARECSFFGFWMARYLSRW